MSWEAFFRGIEDFFVNVAFAPLDALRELELESWFLANSLNWILLIVGLLAFGYWMNELKKYNDNDEEDRSVVSHPFLGKNAENVRR